MTSLHQSASCVGNKDFCFYPIAAKFTPSADGTTLIQIVLEIDLLVSDPYNIKFFNLDWEIRCPKEYKWRLYPDYQTSWVRDLTPIGAFPSNRPPIPDRYGDFAPINFRNSLSQKNYCRPESKRKRFYMAILNCFHHSLPLKYQLLIECRQPMSTSTSTPQHGIQLLWYRRSSAIKWCSKKTPFVKGIRKWCRGFRFIKETTTIDISESFNVHSLEGWDRPKEQWGLKDALRKAPHLEVGQPPQVEDSGIDIVETKGGKTEHVHWVRFGPAGPLEKA